MPSLARPHHHVADDDVLSALGNLDAAPDERDPRRRRRMSRDGEIAIGDAKALPVESDHAADFEHHNARPLCLDSLGDRARPRRRQRGYASDLAPAPAREVLTGAEQGGLLRQSV